MRKTIIRAALLLFTAAVILFIIFRGRSPFGNRNSSFASVPVKEITKIEFSYGGRKLSLEKEEDKWLLNGKLETRRSSIIFIDRILREMKIKSPVSSDIFETEIIENDILPVMVKVYEKRHLLKSFLVFKTGSNIYGNIMKIKERSKPFIVYVPGHENDIGSVFSLNELYWQPYTVFNLLPSEISTVTFENFSDTSSSFSIIKNNHHFILNDMTRALTGWDSAMVKRYLTYFTWIPFETWAFELGDEEKKRIEAKQPLYRISVTTIGDNKTVLTLWEKMTTENSSEAIDSDRLLGKTQKDDEFFIMRYFDVDPLIKKRSYFFPQ